MLECGFNPRQRVRAGSLSDKTDSNNDGLMRAWCSDQLEHDPEFSGFNSESSDAKNRHKIHLKKHRAMVKPQVKNRRLLNDFSDWDLKMQSSRMRIKLPSGSSNMKLNPSESNKKRLSILSWIMVGKYKKMHPKTNPHDWVLSCNPASSWISFNTHTHRGSCVLRKPRTKYGFYISYRQCKSRCFECTQSSVRCDQTAWSSDSTAIEFNQ